MNVVLNTALSGMAMSARRLDASATNVAAARNAASPPEAVPTIDPAAETVQQITAGATYKANAKVARVADDMLKSVLDMKV